MPSSGGSWSECWDPDEFLSDYGIRSLSRTHQAHPFVFDGQSVGYEPAEAITKNQGGKLELAGTNLVPDLLPADRVAAQAGQGVWARERGGTPGSLGQPITFGEMAQSLAERLIRIFARDPATGRRAVHGDRRKCQDDPHWNDLILFYEYFHGDTGAAWAHRIRPVGRPWSPRSSMSGESI